MWNLLDTGCRREGLLDSDETQLCYCNEWWEMSGSFGSLHEGHGHDEPSSVVVDGQHYVVSVKPLSFGVLS